MRPRFEEIIVNEQKLFSIQEKFNEVIEIINKELETQLEINVKSTSEETWADLLPVIQASANSEKSSSDPSKADIIMQKICYKFLYPRLDVHVSMSMNHLLKSPFSVHPKTGNICIPFLVENVDDFRINQVPTITSLCEGSSSLEGPVSIFNEVCERIKNTSKSERNKRVVAIREQKGRVINP